MNEYITEAAIQQDGKVWSTPRLGRHHTVMENMWYRGISCHEGHVQGFVTSLGRFVNREEACIIAEKAGQIIRKTNPYDELFSEDLW